MFRCCSAILKIFLFLSYFSLSAFAYQPGTCKYRPGDIQTPINKDPSKIEKLGKILGPWMVALDEKSQAADLACFGCRFDHIGDRLIRLSRSYLFTREKLRHMAEMGQLDPDDK